MALFSRLVESLPCLGMALLVWDLEDISCPPAKQLLQLHHNKATTRDKMHAYLDWMSNQNLGQTLVSKNFYVFHFHSAEDGSNLRSEECQEVNSRNIQQGFTIVAFEFNDFKSFSFQSFRLIQPCCFSLCFTNRFSNNILYKNTLLIYISKAHAILLYV